MVKHILCALSVYTDVQRSSRFRINRKYSLIEGKVELGIPQFNDVIESILNKLFTKRIYFLLSSSRLVFSYKDSFTGGDTRFLSLLRFCRIKSSSIHIYSSIVQVSLERRFVVTDLFVME